VERVIAELEKLVDSKLTEQGGTPVANLISVDSTTEVKLILMRLIDVLKPKLITTVFTSLTTATPRCLAAFANLKQICEERLTGRYQIEVIDLFENPKLARGDQILAIPTLVRKLPPPIKKISGDLSNTECVLLGLHLRPKPESENE